LGAVNQFVREFSRSFPLLHHVWGIGGDNVGLIQSTKAPNLTTSLPTIDPSLRRGVWLGTDARGCLVRWRSLIEGEMHRIYFGFIYVRVTSLSHPSLEPFLDVYTL